MLLEAQERTLAEHGVDGRFSAAWFFYRNFLRGKTPRDVQGLIDLLRRLFGSISYPSDAARFLKFRGGSSWWWWLLYLAGAPS